MISSLVLKNNKPFNAIKEMRWHPFYWKKLYRFTLETKMMKMICSEKSRWRNAGKSQEGWWHNMAEDQTEKKRKSMFSQAMIAANWQCQWFQMPKLCTRHTSANCWTAVLLLLSVGLCMALMHSAQSTVHHCISESDCQSEEAVCWVTVKRGTTTTEAPG